MRSPDLHAAIDHQVNAAIPMIAALFVMWAALPAAAPGSFVTVALLCPRGRVVTPATALRMAVRRVTGRHRILVISGPAWSPCDA
jgi:hypothetical protein